MVLAASVVVLPPPSEYGVADDDLETALMEKEFAAREFVNDAGAPLREAGLPRELELDSEP